MTDCGDILGGVCVGEQYLIEDVVASLARGDLDQPVQTLGGLLNQNVPAAGVVLLPTQTHHLESDEGQTHATKKGKCSHGDFRYSLRRAALMNS